MSTPLYQQQPPPPPPPMAEVTASQQPYGAGVRHGSVGGVIAAVAIITMLGVLAGLIGRMCSGGRVLGHGQYDMEGWVERKCSSCIDGHLHPPPPPRPRPDDVLPRAMAEPEEVGEEDQKRKDDDDDDDDEEEEERNEADEGASGHHQRHSDKAPQVKGEVN